MAGPSEPPCSRSPSPELAAVTVTVAADRRRRCRARARPGRASAQPADRPGDEGDRQGRPRARGGSAGRGVAMRWWRSATSGSASHAAGAMAQVVPRGAVRDRRSWFDHLSEGGEAAVDERRHGAGAAAEGVGDVGVGETAVEAEDRARRAGGGGARRARRTARGRRARRARSGAGRAAGTGAGRGGASGMRSRRCGGGRRWWSSTLAQRGWSRTKQSWTRSAATSGEPTSSTASRTSCGCSLAVEVVEGRHRTPSGAEPAERRAPRRPPRSLSLHDLTPGSTGSLQTDFSEPDRAAGASEEAWIDLGEGRRSRRCSSRGTGGPTAPPT